MKAPLSWLREYVAVDLPVEELAERLALTGTEVERVEMVGVPDDEAALERFVVGKVLTCEPHPNSDHLSVCVVDTAEGQTRTIVCGAPNVAAGQTVPVALPGAVMPNGMVIKDAKLRGVKSSGMICSEEELGLAPKSDGILVLPDDWTVGDLVVDYLPISEAVLDVEVTPNRPDCLSIRGLAREIAAITDGDFEEDLDQDVPWGEHAIHEDVSIEVWDPDLCPRYAARVVLGVKVAPSPAWLKAKITHAGMRPVNNVVDVTNYVMWALGEPMHAFDLSTIRGKKVIARRARAGEPITTLDGVDRVLTEDMLVIADAERASVIAGLMGSLDSEVTDDTTDLLLEAATFSGASLMRTSGALGLRTEASTRFEKGLDPNLCIPALDMACRLIVEICGGQVSVGTIDVNAGGVEPWEVTLRPARAHAVLGEEVPASEIESILGRLGCNVIDCGEDDLCVEIPTFRRDLEREIDLIEEVARIHGLDQLPSTLPGRPEGRGGLTPDQARLRRVEDVLQGAGLSQVITYSFAESGIVDKLRLTADDPRRRVVTISNPLSSDQSVMRTSLLPGLLGAAARNVSMREERIHVFEVGKTYHPGGDVLPGEVRRVGLLLLGPWAEHAWTTVEVPTDFYLAKGILERLALSLGLEADYAPADEPFLHPGKSARIESAGAVLGWVGEVHPLVLQAFDLPPGAVAAEVDLDRVLSLVPGTPLFEDLLTYPVLEQDLALVVDRTLPAAAVVRAVSAAGGPLLRAVRIFDLYEGSQLPEGKKSLALRLTFRSADRTLSESEVNEARVGMLAGLKADIGADLRG
jgi:phenylalanyl-tRNA synthetase beta chain